MKKIPWLFVGVLYVTFCDAQAVAIGTTIPNAATVLHVDAGSNTTKGMLFTGMYNETNGTVPNLGAGSRLMFYPGKAAFRAGLVMGTQWDNANVGHYSTAIGYNTVASGLLSTAIGFGGNAIGDYSVAMGDKTIASGPNSTAMGTFSIASGNRCTAMGTLTIASGSHSVTMGLRSIAKGYASTVLGIYNDSILTQNQINISATTPLFIIGNGDEDNRSNAMVVLKNGNIGIGTNAPTEKLVLNAAASATLQLQAAGVDKGFVQLSGDNLRLGTYSANDLGNVTFRLNGSDRFIILPNGNATLTGTLTQNSDERFKQDITPINDALDKVMQLNGYEYYWKPELQRDSALQIGLIAQNVEKVLPQLVATDKEGTKSVAYQNMVPVLIEAMKEQQQRIEKLESKIKELQKSQSPGK